MLLEDYPCFSLGFCKNIKIQERHENCFPATSPFLENKIVVYSTTKFLYGFNIYNFSDHIFSLLGSNYFTPGGKNQIHHVNYIMTSITTVANQKGGTGKTTTVVELASFISTMGHKTLLIDLDPQANATDYLIEDRPNLSTADLLLNDDIDIQQTITTTDSEHLDIIPATPALSGVGVKMSSDVDMQFKLKNSIGTGLDKYEYVFIDTPPTLGFLTINAFTASDDVLIPMQAGSYFAMDGVNNLMDTIKKIQQSLNPKLSCNGIVLTMYDKRTLICGQVKEQMENEFPGLIYETVIPINVRLSETPSYHKSIREYDPSSTGAAAYEKLANEFLGIEKKIEVVQELAQQ